MYCLIFALLLLAHSWAGAGFERVATVCWAVLSARSKGVDQTPVRVASLRTLTGQPTETQTRGVWVPPGTEVFPAADLDGNSQGDSRWAYVWDGENRLIRVTSQAGAVSAGAPYQMLTFRYDALGRLLERKEYGGSAVALVLSNTTTYLYGGWKNLCTWKAVGAGASTLQATQVWGLSELGGGIEGLLFYKSAANGAHACAYDGGGNLTGLVALSNGTVSGQYEYDAFGTLLRQGGVSAVEAENPWRFSTKRMDPVSGLMHYEYRAYNPALGRWLSRDPIGENGGANLFGFVNNRPTGLVDIDGRVFLEDIDRTIDNWVDPRHDLIHPYNWPALGLGTLKNALVAFSIGSVCKNDRLADRNLAGEITDDQYWKGATANAATAAASVAAGVAAPQAAAARGAGLALQYAAGGFAGSLTDVAGTRLGYGAADISYEGTIASDARQVATGTALGFGLGGVARGAGILLGKCAAPSLGRSASRMSLPAEEGGFIGDYGNQTCAAAKTPRQLLDAFPKGKQPHVRLVKTEQELSALHDQLTAGGTSMPPGRYPGSVTELPDGTIIKMRSESLSGGSAIDITYPNGKTGKVHIE